MMMLTQTIAKRRQPSKTVRLNARESPRPLASVRRPGKLYSLTAEISYITRWLALKAISSAVLLPPGRREPRERWIIKLGNKLFAPRYSHAVHASYESYASFMGASLELYDELYPMQRWLCGRDVLDLGSGLGQYSHELLKHGAASVTGLEYQAAKARWSASQSTLPRLRFVTGSAEAMPFDAESFDTVFSHTVFEHIADVPAALREIRRVLRPGGVAVLSYNFFHHRGGHHLHPYVHFPWAPWLIRERALCEYWSECLRDDQSAGRMAFFEPGTRIRSLSQGSEIQLNKLAYDEFEAMLPKAGLRIVRRRSSEQLMQLFPFLRFIPRVRYFLTGTVYYALQRG